jgi:hypothetical protein
MQIKKTNLNPNAVPLQRFDFKFARGDFIYYLAVSSTVVDQTVGSLRFNSTESRKMVQCSTNGGFIYYLAVSSTVVDQTVGSLRFNSTESRKMVQCSTKCWMWFHLPIRAMVRVKVKLV